MIIRLKKGASKEENLMWAKTQQAHQAGFKPIPDEAHREDCNCCDRQYAIKIKPLTKEDMINGRG